MSIRTDITSAQEFTANKKNSISKKKTQRDRMEDDGCFWTFYVNEFQLSAPWQTESDGLFYSSGWML